MHVSLNILAGYENMIFFLVGDLEQEQARKKKLIGAKKTLHGHRGDYAGNEYRNNNIFDKEAKKSYSF